MRSAISMVLLASLVWASAADAQPRNEPLVAQVKDAIDRGVRYLRSVQRPDGTWELNELPPVMEGGQTCLATLALLTVGVPPHDPAVAGGLKFVRRYQSDKTYIKALQAMVLAEAKLPEDRILLNDHVKWLMNARVLLNGRLVGWDYSDRSNGIADGSNTQYAVLGLWSAKQAGADVPDSVFEEIRRHYLDSQDPKSGGWIYAPGVLSPSNKASLTMTTAGVSGLLIASQELNGIRERFAAAADPAANCGVYPDSKAIAAGFEFISGNFRIELRPRTFYHLYGLERAGRLSGERFFGEYDWYREGCQFLVPLQKQNGSWSLPAAWDQWPVVSTSMSLLFLSKGRTPVLMSKLVHGAWPRRPLDTDWNNDRNDLRNIVAHASKELFKNQPLAWQSVDIMKAASSRQAVNLTEADMQALTSDLLQSPILYITGHQSPDGRFTAVEKNLIKRYIDNGGFVLAEACCGSPAFDQGFKRLVAELWPDNELTPLEADHPIWQSPTIVAPGQPYTLLGLNQGCKTVVVYSPQDLSCRWEMNKPTEPNSVQAFRLGLNIIAYATGMQPPAPRLSQTPVASAKTDPAVIPRGTLKVAQIKHSGDWQPAPKAMRNLMEHVHQFAGVDVALKTENRPMHDRELIDFKFLYMPGRSAFRFDKDELEPLRFNLLNGGLLFADASCGKEAYDAAFRKFVDALFPGKSLERVPPTDPLFSKEIAGEPLNEQTIRLRSAVGQPFQNSAPYLEGIKHDGRWIVLYSKYDIGCALEKHQSPGCRGYDTPSAQRLARAAILYALHP